MITTLRKFRGQCQVGRSNTSLSRLLRTHIYFATGVARIIFKVVHFLQVHFMGFPGQLLCGEVKHVSVEFSNTGEFALHNLQVASTNPEFFTFGTGSKLPATARTYQNMTKPMDTNEFVAEETEVKHVMNVPLPGGSLAPGTSVTLPLWIRGPDVAGDHKIHILFCYESSVTNPKLR